MVEDSFEHGKWKVTFLLLQLDIAEFIVWNIQGLAEKTQFLSNVETNKTTFVPSYTLTFVYLLYVLADLDLPVPGAPGALRLPEPAPPPVYFLR